MVCNIEKNTCSIKIREKMLREYLFFDGGDFKKLEEGQVKDYAVIENDAPRKTSGFTQLDIMNSILERHNTLVVMPTGSGKSWCFQGPAMCMEGLTVVITPLVALIKDQVSNFNARQLKREAMEESGKTAEQPDGKTAEVSAENAEGKTAEVSCKRKRFRAIAPGEGHLSTEQMFARIAASAGNDSAARITASAGDDSAARIAASSSDGNAAPSGDENAENYEIKLLYLSPERLDNPKFLRVLEKYENRGRIKISQIVIDEAHCLAQWGFEFRESYLKILNFVNKRRDHAVISAFTATATPMDIRQIETVLGFVQAKGNDKRYNGLITPSDYRQFVCNRSRQELNLTVLRCREELPDYELARMEAQPAPGLYLRISNLVMLLKHFRRYHGSEYCIVYCSTVEQVEHLYEVLTTKEQYQKMHFEYCTVRYHGGLTDWQRKRVTDAIAREQQTGERNSYRVILATKAFGMGIDIPNVCLVIHYDVPRSLEDYSQEFGRAGRNGRSSACVLLYTRGFGRVRCNGNLNHMISWMFESEGSMGDENTFIGSRFTEEMKTGIHVYNFYRQAKVWQFLETAGQDRLDVWDAYRDSENSRAAKTFVREYFNEEKIDVDTVNAFTRYIDESMKFPAGHTNRRFRESFNFKRFWTGVAAGKTDLELYTDSHSEQNSKELLEIVRGNNELHICNTPVANFLRWHPEDYTLGQWKNLDSSEWRRKDLKEGFHTLIRTSIHENSAFVQISEYWSPDCLWRINFFWNHKTSKDNDPEFLYVVYHSNSMIVTILRRNEKDTAWVETEDRMRAEAAHEAGTGAEAGAGAEAGTGAEDGTGAEVENRPGPSTPVVPGETLVKGLFTKAAYPEWRAIEALPPLPEDQDHLTEEQKESYGRLFVYANGKRKRKTGFCLSTLFVEKAKKDPESCKPTYFDLCVLDAIYSIYQNGQSLIFVSNIWAVLTGKTYVCFSRSNSKPARMIEESIARMNGLRLAIQDSSGFIQQRPFLYMEKCPGAKAGYQCKEIPTLFLHAIAANGEIIRVPDNLLNVTKAGALWKGEEKVYPQGEKIRIKTGSGFMADGFSFDSYKPEEEEKTLGVPFQYEGPRRLLYLLPGRPVKVIEEKPDDDGSAFEVAEEKPDDDGSAFEVTEEKPDDDGSAFEVAERETVTENLGDEPDCGAAAQEQVFAAPDTHVMQASVEHVVLCHYFLHRASIARHSHRGCYIPFDSVKRIMLPYIKRKSKLDGKDHVSRSMETLTREILELGVYYNEIGFIKSYVYKPEQEFSVSLGDTQEHFTETAYFELLPRRVAYFGTDREGKAYIHFMDFVFRWTNKPYRIIRPSSSKMYDLIRGKQKSSSQQPEMPLLDVKEEVLTDDFDIFFEEAETQDTDGVSDADETKAPELVISEETKIALAEIRFWELEGIVVPSK